ncbi:MAG: hypothetical protein KIC89_19365 [Acetobacteraceae bacterium]|nr:hypothetical protein [Acetobacteraceae bacterium]
MTLPCDLLRLTSSEHLLLWCLRTVVQRGEDAEIHQGIVGAFEGEGEGTARALYRFLFLLGLGARRPILMEAPGCLRVTSDERRLLATLALAQSAARALAHALLEQDHHLPLPASQAPAPVPEPGGRVRLRLVASVSAAPAAPHPEPLMRSAMPWPETAR